LLAEAGLKVAVVDCSHADFAPCALGTLSAVARVRPCRHTQLYKEKLPPAGVRLWRSFVFGQQVARVIRQRRPKVVIAYDPYAMVAVGPLWRRHDHPHLLWHFHELCSRATKPAGRLSGRAVEFACNHAARVSLVCHADTGRAELFARETAAKLASAVVINCGRRLAQVPEEHLTVKLAERGLAGVPAVCFHGWIGPSRCLEILIESMRWWPEPSVFVAIGPVADAYRSRLVALSHQLRVEQRLLFVGSVPYGNIFHLAAGAAVGVSLVADSRDPNWIYSAGAINKRFEYMAVGVPQVANIGPGMKDILERPDCGILANPNVPEAVGRAIGSLLENVALRHQMGRNGRKAHLEEFNYEKQFAPVLDRILHWIR
jgi:glycosyltransferase involved in cell wall biosynthesis